MAPRGGASYAAAAGGAQAQGPRGQGGQVQAKVPNVTYPVYHSRVLLGYSLSIDWKAVKPTARMKDLVDFIIKDLKIQASDIRAVSVEQVTGLLILQLATKESFQVARERLRQGVLWTFAGGDKVMGWSPDEALTNLKVTNYPLHLKLETLVTILGQFGRVVRSSRGMVPGLQGVADNSVHISMQLDRGARLPAFVRCEEEPGRLSSYLIVIQREDEGRKCFRCGRGHNPFYCRETGPPATLAHLWAVIRVTPEDLTDLGREALAEETKQQETDAMDQADLQDQGGSLTQASLAEVQSRSLLEEEEESGDLGDPFATPAVLQDPYATPEDQAGHPTQHTLAPGQGGQLEGSQEPDLEERESPMEPVGTDFITGMQGEAWEFARKGRKKGAARGKGGAPSARERLRGGSESSTDRESGSSKTADRLSNRTVAYFLKATSQDFKEPDKPQKKRKSVCAAATGPAYKITALGDQASGLSSGEDG